MKEVLWFSVGLVAGLAMLGISGIILHAKAIQALSNPLL